MLIECRCFYVISSRWCHQMETFSALLALCERLQFWHHDNSHVFSVTTRKMIFWEIKVSRPPSSVFISFVYFVSEYHHEMEIRVTIHKHIDVWIKWTPFTDENFKRSFANEMFSILTAKTKIEGSLSQWNLLTISHHWLGWWLSASKYFFSHF